jgi:MFS superfamily sulfate permease-like transporter
MNEDLVVNGLDVDPFVAAVVGDAQQIPEPSTLLLGLLALCILAGWRKWGV